MPMFWILLCLAASWIGFRTIVGRSRFGRLKREMEGEGMLREKGGVLMTVNFPLLKRITFVRVLLSRRRLVIVHGLTRGKILQAPVGPEGSCGTEEGTFEARGAWLVFRTTMRGGGRVRMRIPEAREWIEAIRAN